MRDLFADSALVGFLLTLGQRVASAARHSILLGRARDWQSRVASLDLPGRIRCGGVLVLSAILTHEALLLIVPRQAAPAGLYAILGPIALASAAAVWAAPALASAWVARVDQRRR